MNSDTISINGSYTLSGQVITKREALHSISKIYDPLGFSPATLSAKLFMQEPSKQKLEWDEIFSESLQQEWFKLYDDVTPLSAVPIPRYMVEMTTNCSASLMIRRKHIQQQYTCTPQ